MNDEIEIFLLLRSAEFPPHVVCFIGRTRNVYFSSIGSEEMSQSLACVVTVMGMMMLVRLVLCCRACWRVGASMWSICHLMKGIRIF